MSVDKPVAGKVLEVTKTEANTGSGDNVVVPETVKKEEDSDSGPEEAPVLHHALDDNVATNNTRVEKVSEEHAESTKSRKRKRYHKGHYKTDNRINENVKENSFRKPFIPRKRKLTLLERVSINKL